MVGHGGTDQEETALRILAQAESGVRRDIETHEKLMDDLKAVRKTYLNLIDELLQLHAQHHWHLYTSPYPLQYHCSVPSKHT